jgi:hypothetical protein
LRRGEQLYQFFALVIIDRNLLIELFGDAIERDAVIRFNDEFLLEPELSLEIFKLRKKLDNLTGNSADNLNSGEILLDSRCSFIIHIVQEHDFIFDKEIKFTTQECSEILHLTSEAKFMVEERVDSNGPSYIRTLESSRRQTSAE